MTRVVALLLIFALGMQSLAAAPASSPMATSHDAPAHCDEMDSGDHDMPAQQDHKDCACCPDMDMNAQGCASYCAAILAIVPSVPFFGSNARALYAREHAAALHSRFDIPPTPPPIA